MPDRDKVIKEFEHLLNEAKGDYMDFADLTVDFGEEILALLKEQEEIIHCKDCIHWSEEYDHNCMIRQGWFSVSPDYFCASGERKEGR